WSAAARQSNVGDNARGERPQIVCCCLSSSDGRRRRSARRSLQGIVDTRSGDLYELRTVRGIVINGQGALPGAGCGRCKRESKCAGSWPGYWCGAIVAHREISAYRHTRNSQWTIADVLQRKHFRLTAGGAHELRNRKIGDRSWRRDYGQLQARDVGHK